MEHRNRTIQLTQGVTIQIRWEYDDYADFSYLGKWTDRRDEFVIDRKEGVLLGKYKSTEFEVAVDEDDYDAAEILLRKLADDAGYEHLELESDMRGELVDDKYVFTAEVNGYEVLASDLGNHWERNSYRYWEPTNDQEKDGAENNYQYLIEDWQRMERYGDDWSYVYCDVEVHINGVEEASASLSGIEDDSGDEYFEEVEKDRICEALSDLDLDEIIADLRSTADHLETLNVEQLLEMATNVE